jgi:hypothetical protein
MKSLRSLLSLLLLGLFIFLSFYTLMPRRGTPATAPLTEFSTDRALSILRKISKAPHYHGSEAHDTVRALLMAELTKLGLDPQEQEGFVYNVGTRGLDKPVNIMARIQGTGSGDALLLLSHYDSALVPSLGASDAGSGIVTILESLRAYLASGKTPKNDIIVLFTDAEEIGLDGAKLFVNEHPWSSDVKLVLNFEARGSGGPSNMIVETNGGNENLIAAFAEANVPYPVASSLMYSVYKLLPNDTDSTIFREDGDIDSFFFAFIDDHFDYHTANDTVENLDTETLQHQGDYLLPLLTHFSDANLGALKSGLDSVYVNLPLMGVIHYPFTWIFPVLLVAFGLFFILLFYGIKKGRLNGASVGRGFLALLLPAIACTALGIFGWQWIENLYPAYDEIQHGFKYNGHDYVAFFVLLSLAITLFSYHWLGKNQSVAGLFVAPIVIWLLINVAVLLYLKGAAYFIIPVFFALLSWWVLLRYKKAAPIAMAMLAAPAIFIFAPLIQFFPVGLGSDHVFISCLFTVLLFGLLVPVFGYFKRKAVLAIAAALASVGFLIAAHLESDFSEARQKPNSLVYHLDLTKQEAHWLTYDGILDDWTKGYFGDDPLPAAELMENASGSKYGIGYTYAAQAPLKDIASFDVKLLQDTTYEQSRHVRLRIVPRRKVNQLNLYADTAVTFQSLQFNGQDVPRDSSGYVSKNRNSKTLLRYWMDNRDSLEIQYSVPETEVVSFTAMEFSFDLLEHPHFSIHRRPKATMPKPFVITDAIVTKKTFAVDSLEQSKQPTKIDSIEK